MKFLTVKKAYITTSNNKLSVKRKKNRIHYSLTISTKMSIHYYKSMIVSRQCTLSSTITPTFPSTVLTVKPNIFQPRDICGLH